MAGACFLVVAQVSAEGTATHSSATPHSAFVAFFQLFAPKLWLHLLFAFRDFALSSRRNINGAQHEMIRGEGEEWEALRRSWVSNLERVVMKKKLYNARFCLGGWSLRLEVGRQIQEHNAIIPLIFIWNESARLEGQWTDFFLLSVMSLWQEYATWMEV